VISFANIKPGIRSPGQLKRFLQRYKPGLVGARERPANLIRLRRRITLRLRPPFPPFIGL